MGTGGDSQAQPIGLGVRRRRGDRPPCRALLALGGEAIPVGAVRPQSRDLDVNAVGCVPRGGYVSRRGDMTKAFLGGDFPTDRDRVGKAAQAVGAIAQSGDADLISKATAQLDELKRKLYQLLAES